LHRHVETVGTPVLVEANDIAFVAVLTPMYCALLAAAASRRCRWVAGASLALGVSAICVLQSRTPSWRW
jgi:hypothetical protein